jgi:hypothetical protein
MSKEERGPLSLERLFQVPPPPKKKRKNSTAAVLCPTCGRVPVKHWSYNCYDCVERLNGEEV